MKKIKGYLILLILLFIIREVNAQFVSIKETSAIADNWIQMIIDRYGQWGAHEFAAAEPMQELRHNNRLIGYYCDVKPKGFIIISLRRELAPVKAYSDRHNIDLSHNQGLAQLIKSRMLGTINSIESRLGPVESVTSSEFETILEIDKKGSWDYIANYIPGTIDKNLYTAENYVEGDSLLDTKWHQEAPYNNQCPNDIGPNSQPCASTSNGRALVGCTAIAMAQIMKYWCWPPWGEASSPTDPYDWVNMPNHATVGTGTSDDERKAVAELCYDVALAVETRFGCDISWAYMTSQPAQFEGNFRYNCTVYKRPADKHQWSNWLKAEINLGQPVLYNVKRDLFTPGHVIVCDGWQEIAATLQFHFNYGWNNKYTAWYDLDDLIVSASDNMDSNWDHENALFGTVPEVAVGSNLAPMYQQWPFPYRYFDRDASGLNSMFQPGQLLQTLPGVTITGNGSGSGMYVSFLGSPSPGPTKIYTNGDPSKGVEITNGSIRLSNGGSIKLQ